MSNPTSKPQFKLRFFFDYHCGGCLWSGNEAAYENFGSGTLDAETVDMDGNIIREAKIKLPQHLRDKVVELDKQYSQSLNWNDPSSPSLWNATQWDTFNKQAKELYNEIVAALGQEFEIVYQQE